MTKLYGYYKIKTEALALIKKMALAGQDIKTIQMLIYETYGMSDKFVLEYLEKLASSGWIKVRNDTITPLVEDAASDTKQMEKEADEVFDAIRS